MNIFVTGGAGYVGSHCVKYLCDQGHAITVYDNMTRGHIAAVDERAELIVGDIGDSDHLDAVFADTAFDAVMHFAASMEVGESVENPLKYYRNNIANTCTLLECMRRANIDRIVFSSTCATYGVPEVVPIRDDTRQQPINPYGRTKLAVEWMLRDSAAAWGLGSCSLRYFNACGASHDGSIGEDHDPETHLIPIILQVALGQRDGVRIFGSDYDTPDGTCIRDYVHVEDLATAHLLVLNAVQPGQARAYNLGTGQGSSVREVIEAARSVTGHAIPAEQSPRRAGDPPRLVADAGRVVEELGWQPEWTDIRAIVDSAWQWHREHPDGFSES